MKSHLVIESVEERPKTNVFLVKSKHDDTNLGVIEWNGAWRQYCFYPNTDIETQWSWDCLQELTDYIKGLMDARKVKQ